MTLREHLFYARKTVATFAKEIGVSRGYLSRIINEGYQPSLIFARYIQEMTGGEVTISELRGNKNPGK